MLRRTAFLALMSLALSGCVTYEVVERRVYHADGSYTRTYDPYEDGRRYEYDSPRYGGYDDPYDRWFYGYRGYGSAWALDPYFSGGGSRWGWSPSWYSGFYGHGYGYTPSRPYHPRPQHPRPAEPRPMPKPTVRRIGPDVSLPVMRGPSIGGEALRPAPRAQRWEERDSPTAMPDAMPREKPRPVFIEAPPREAPRFERREPERVFERRVDEPRVEPRETPRDAPEVDERIE
jgi:hypothetical protein